MKREKIFKYKHIFRLENGDALPEVEIKYTTYGQLNEEATNVIWVVHALTADSNVDQWWPGIVGKGFVIDTDKFFVICASVIGGHYGSSNPLSLHPQTGKAYFHDFPQITIRDMVKAYDLLRVHLNLKQIHTIIGASIGGQQVLEWMIYKPGLFLKSVLIACNGKHSPWGIAFNESQRMAIESDHTWNLRNEYAGLTGLKTARSIALLSYRTIFGYNQSQGDEEDKLNGFKASSYQRYQGEKLAERYNAYSYYRLTEAMDSHDVGRGRGSISSVLNGLLGETNIVGIDSDLLFPLEEQRVLAELIPNSKLYTIRSDFGHDGFLIEVEQLSMILNEVLFSKKIRPNPIDKTIEVKFENTFSLKASKSI